MYKRQFLVTVLAFVGLLDKPEEERQFTQVLFDWIPAGGLSVEVGFLADPLSITMCLFITGVGTLIHLYSVGYMHGDENFAKFFVYLNLFAFSMLMLVLGDNLLLTFLGWEGVGACSYFLISFWFTEEANATAGKKAFVTNRIGDWGFMVATFLIFVTIGSIEYVDIIGNAEGGLISESTATWITVLLLIAAAGKSAQFPLYLWLPDAMVRHAASVVPEAQRAGVAAGSPGSTGLLRVGRRGSTTLVATGTRRGRLELAAVLAGGLGVARALGRSLARDHGHGVELVGAE